MVDHLPELVHRKIDMSCNMTRSICPIQHFDGGLEPVQGLRIEVRTGGTVIAIHGIFRAAEASCCNV